MWRGVLSDTFLFSSWLVRKKSASEALKQTPNFPSSQCFHVQFQFAHLKHSNSLQNSHVNLQVANQTQCKFLSHKSPRASAAVRDGNLWEKLWLVGFDQIESPWIPGIVNGEPKRTRFFSSKRSAVLPHPKMTTFLTPRSSISSTWRARKLCFEFECVAFLRGHFRELRRSRVVKRKTFDC